MLVWFPVPVMDGMEKSISGFGYDPSKLSTFPGKGFLIKELQGRMERYRFEGDSGGINNT